MSFLTAILFLSLTSVVIVKGNLAEFKKWATQYLPHNIEPFQHYSTWRRNSEYVKHHNSLVQQDGGMNYTLTLNHFAHLDRHELYKAFVLSSMYHYKASIGITLYDETATKVNVDWRKKGVVTAVQYDGCSQVLTLVDSISSANAIKTGHLVPYSGEQVTDCCYGCECDPGPVQTNPPTTCVARYGGVCRDIDYPWTSNMCMCHECVDGSVRLSVKDYGHVTNGSENELALAVNKQPVMVAIDSSQKSFQMYSSGIYHSTNCSSTNLDHMMLVVGYGTTGDGQDYWLCKNCWGKGWGMDGYVMMARNKNNMCGIATKSSYPIL